MIKIWQWLTVAHIPGKDNIIADGGESRKSRRETEWALNPQIYQDAIAHLGQTPDIDLFASRLKYKCKLYAFYQPDPGAFVINALHLAWESPNFYAFPPFCVIQKVLQKIRKDSATGVILVPYWPTQAWWPVLTNMLVAYPLSLTQETEHTPVTIRPSANPPTEQNNQTATLLLVRGLLQSQGLSETASTIILQAWRCGTTRQYSSYLRRWEQYSSTRTVDPISATVIDGVSFLNELYHKELSYSAINTARAALSAVIHPPEGCTFGNHPLVARFLKGVFSARPALPRY